MKMLAFQALPTPNPLKTKKYWRNMALAVTVAVVITVVLTSQIVSVTQANGSSSNLDTYPPGPHTQKVLSGSIVLNPQGYFFGGFYVPDEAKNAVLHGNYTVVNNSTHSAAVMTIWSQQEFINYISNHNASPCYNKDMFPMASGDINVTLSSGQYIILIGGATAGTNILQAEIDLDFTI